MSEQTRNPTSKERSALDTLSADYTKLRLALLGLVDAAEDTLRSHSLDCCTVTHERCAQARRVLSDDSSAPETRAGSSCDETYYRNIEKAARAVLEEAYARDRLGPNSRSIKALVDAFNHVIPSIVETAAPETSLACTCPACAPSLWAAGIKGTAQQPEKASTEQPTFVHVGNVFGYDAEGDVLVDWDNEQHEPKEGTLLFVRLWTQAEIDAAHKAGEELFRGLQRAAENGKGDET